MLNNQQPRMKSIPRVFLHSTAVVCTQLDIFLALSVFAFWTSAFIMCWIWSSYITCHTWNNFFWGRNTRRNITLYDISKHAFIVIFKHGIQRFFSLSKLSSLAYSLLNFMFDVCLFFLSLLRIVDVDVVGRENGQ